jgi:hypothetical protein
VAGSLRYFADRFGTPRASIEGTTLPYDLVGRYATLSTPRVVLAGPRKQQRLMLERHRTYFGFDLETELEPIDGHISADLQQQARERLADSIIAGETHHPDQGRVRRALTELDELWRRSGGTLTRVSPPALRSLVLRALQGVSSWDDFMRTRVLIDPAGMVDQPTRERLEALPSRLHVRGDAVPLDYEIEDGQGVARVRLREGQAKRLRPNELPELDRPLRFAVQRGRHPPVLADSIADLKGKLRRMPTAAADDRYEFPSDGQRRGRRHQHRSRPPHRRGGRPRR